MTPLEWRYNAPFLRPGTAVAFTQTGQLVGAYRKRFRRYLVTLDLITTQPTTFRSEENARAYLLAVAASRQCPS